jgi:arylsulfatase A-like enzyme
VAALSGGQSSLVALTRARLGKAAQFYVWASSGFFVLLARELRVGSPDVAHLVTRALLLITLSCRYSVLLGVPLAFVHLARSSLVRRTSHADALLTLLFGLTLAHPCYVQAELLSTGSLLLDSSYAMPARWAIWVCLIAANVLLWRVHLLACVPTHGPRGRLRRKLANAPRFLSALWLAAWLALGVCLLVVFGRTVAGALRAYVFLSRFLLPSAWLFAASLAFGVRIRIRRRAAWPDILAGLVLASGLVGAGYYAAPVRRAKAEFERRGGCVALADLAVSEAKAAPYANLDITRPERFRCQSASPAPESSNLQVPARARRNVILISVDTLRKDALQMQIGARPVTPSLQRIAAQSTLFDSAVTTYPATLFALGSALTGQSPSEIMFAPRPPPNLFSLTRALFPAPLLVLPSAGWFRRAPVPELLTQSATPAHFVNAEQSTSYFISRLREARRNGQRSFAWIHYYEPHTSQGNGQGAHAEQTARASYMRLVHDVDTQIGRLWQELDELGYLRDSLLLLFSDHGEALGELEYFGHHVYLNRFVSDVPLIMHVPGQAAARETRQVSLLDIAPTVLEWLGLPLPAGDAQSLFSNSSAPRYAISEAFPVRGKALYDVAREPITDARALAERMQLIRTAALDYQPKVSVISARYRLIVNRETGAEEFYDRVNDPDEEHDLSDADLGAHRDMRAALEHWNERLSERIYCRVQAVAKPPADPH